MSEGVIAASEPTWTCIFTCFCLATAGQSRRPGLGSRPTGYLARVTVLAIAGICLLLLLLAFLVPRLSRGPQRGVDRTLGAGQRAGPTRPQLRATSRAGIRSRRLNGSAPPVWVAGMA